MKGAVPGNARADTTERIRLMLGATILTAGGRDWTGRDLVTAGALSGRWSTLEAGLVQGLASLEHWTPPRELVNVGLRDFRYARRLISAAEFSDWLRRRGLIQQELTGAVERRLARDHDGGPRASSRPGQRQDALAALPAEAVYTGALLDCADWLADRVLCLAEGPAPAIEPADLELLLERERELLTLRAITEAAGDRRARAELILAASAAYDARVADVCSAAAISKLLRHHSLDWLRFEAIEFTSTTAGAAAEITALLREGTPPELITEASGVPERPLRLYLEEAPAAMQGWLGGAVPGTVIGPIAEQDTHRTWLVRARQSPDPSDPSSAGKARTRIVEEHMRRRRAGRVRLHERH